MDQDVCPRCKNKGYLVYDVDRGDPRWNQLVKCDHFRGGDRREAIRLTYGLEWDMQGFSFDTSEWRPEMRPAVTVARALVEAGCGFFAQVGSTGIGKTCLLACITNRARARNLTAYYTRTEAALDMLRDAFDAGADEHYRDRWERLVNVRVLCLDEFYRFTHSDWADGKFAELIIARHAAKDRLLTCLSGNTKLESLPDALRSRIQGDGSTCFTTVGRDRRKGSQH